MTKIQKAIKYYPTPQHEKAAQKIVEFFSRNTNVMSILLTCSCARGKATKDSCLDICIIVINNKYIGEIEKSFETNFKKENAYFDLLKVGRFSHIDLEVTDGNIKPEERGWATGPDEFELAIGNIFIYSVILFDRKNHFRHLQQKYLPYFDEELRLKRYADVVNYMINNLNHVPLMVDRGLYFHAFKRLYDATQEFLQALFIKHKTYPIAYNKWIKEQIAEILGKPELYREFTTLYEVKSLESNELREKTGQLEKMIKIYLEV